jgi:hypothetical protein
MSTVYCIWCQTLKDGDHAFKTGFVNIDGVDYPMGVCDNHAQSEHTSAVAIDG